MKKLGFTFCLLWLCLGVGNARALMVLKLNLQQLTSLADRVFVGECVAVNAGRDINGRYVNYITYRVQKALKGAPANRVTFKQLMPPPDSGSGTVPTAFRDMPRYEVGAVEVVFLSGESEIGLSAPIGLHQGLFRVTEEGGKKLVVGRVGNSWLFQGMKQGPVFKGLKLSTAESSLVDKEGPELGYSPFISLVQKMVEAMPQSGVLP